MFLCSCFHETKRGILYQYIEHSASPLFKKDVLQCFLLTTIYFFVLLSSLIGSTDVSVKMITLVYYRQHSDFFSQERWKTYIC